GGDKSGSLIGIRGRHNSFPGPLKDDILQPGREAFNAGKVKFMTDDGILIAIPDVHIRKHKTLVLDLPLVERSKETLKFFQSTSCRIMNNGEHHLLDLIPYAFDKCQQQRWFGGKVVIECPLG